MAYCKYFFSILVILFSQFLTANQKITIGGKLFSEQFILGEIVALSLEQEGFEVERKFGLGGTMIVFEGLINNEIDLYIEYTGTLEKVILKSDKTLSVEEINQRLKKQNLILFKTLGFNNTYAFGAREEIAKKYNLSQASDLSGHNFVTVMPFEFMNRADGWPMARHRYELKDLQPISMNHTLGFKALQSKKADVIVLYSTDGKILSQKIKVLSDDKKIFPQYFAAILSHNKLPEKVKKIISSLSGTIDDEKMVEMNEKVEVQNISIEQVAKDFLIEIGRISKNDKLSSSSSRLENILRLTWIHILLVVFATSIATLVAIPLGIILKRYSKFAQPLIYVAGLLQTIPSLALLVFMIPYFGVSFTSALVAMILYSLLPILQNTYTGLNSVDPVLSKAATGIGLFKNEILWNVEIPMAMPVIVAGIKTATIINVGMATIAAFIGAGGLGELIVQGLTLNDSRLMLEGAIPAALLAICFNFIFNKIEKRLMVNSN